MTFPATDPHIICDLPEWRLLATCAFMALVSGGMLVRIWKDTRSWRKRNTCQLVNSKKIN